jgi:hypothetical protein
MSKNRHAAPGQRVDVVGFALHAQVMGEGSAAHSEQIIVDGATHVSIVANPDHATQVVDVIRKLVEAAKQSG